MWFFITLMENTELLLLFASSAFQHAPHAFRFAAAGLAAREIPSRAPAASAGEQDLRIQAGSRSYVPKAHYFLAVSKMGHAPVKHIRGGDC
jgi:hypothetical protein